jgi:hypothetical protein
VVLAWSDLVHSLTASSKSISLSLWHPLHFQLVRPLSRPMVPCSKLETDVTLTWVPCSVLIFIITILLLATDFYYLKNIAGRRLVGLRWWNEVDAQSGDSHWVFESSDPSTKTINATDSRFFWLAIYAQPLLWVGLAIVAIVRFEFIWLTLVGEYSIQGGGGWELR